MFIQRYSIWHQVAPKTFLSAAICSLSAQRKIHLRPVFNQAEMFLLSHPIPLEAPSENGAEPGEVLIHPLFLNAVILCKSHNLMLKTNLEISRPSSLSLLLQSSRSVLPSGDRS